jgi:hypothetical protein
MTVMMGVPCSAALFFHPSIVIQTAEYSQTLDTTLFTAWLYALFKSGPATCLRSGGVAPSSARAAFISGLSSLRNGVSETYIN